MSGLTSELALGTAVGADDTANYLTITLANALNTIDGEFSSATGHNHNGAHQGGVLHFSNLLTSMITFDNGATLGPFATGNQLRFQSTNVSFSGNATVDGTLTAATGTITTLNVSGTATLATANVTTLGVGGASTLNGTVSANAINASTVSTSGRITSGTDMLITNGMLYLHPSGDTSISRAAAGALRVPNTMYFGADNAVSIYRSGQIGGTPTPFIVNNPAGGLWIQDKGLTLYNVSDPQGGGQQFRSIDASTRSAATYGGGEIHMGLRLYVDGDIWAGTYVHGISFMTTSDRRLKTGMTVVTDADCIARVRDPGVNVYSYQIPPPLPDSPTRPTSTDIGFDAAELVANSPEFVGINESSEPVAVVYGQIVSLLWGALRQLDARVQALET